MADYTATPFAPGFYDPFIPPDPIPDPTVINVVVCDVGRDELIKLRGGLGGSQVGYFKFGCGGWAPGAELAEQAGISTGSATVLGQTTKYVVAPGTVSVTVDGQTVTDDGAGNLVGTGASGTINYLSGAFTITFTTPPAGAQPVMATYRTGGTESDYLMQDGAIGNGGTGPYTGTLIGVPVVPGSAVFWDCFSQYLMDNGSGVLVDPSGGGGSGTIDYETGDFSVTFGSIVENLCPIRVTHRYWRRPWQPNAGQTDLDAVDKGLFTIRKDLELTDTVYQGAGTRTVRVTCELEAAEGNDDGSGAAPVYYEGGIYTSDDVLVMYFTWPGIKKTSAAALTRVIDLVV